MNALARDRSCMPCSTSYSSSSRAHHHAPQPAALISSTPSRVVKHSSIGHHQHAQQQRVKGFRLSVMKAASKEQSPAEAAGLEITDSSPIVLERGAPQMPRPGQFQQTVARSFTLGGLGLHTAEYGETDLMQACDC